MENIMHLICNTSQSSNWVSPTYRWKAGVHEQDNRSSIDTPVSTTRRESHKEMV